MSATRFLAAACVLLCAGWLGGCIAPSGTSRQPEHADFAPVDVALAEALANFGVGILRDGLHDGTAALKNFERAAELAPEHVRLSFHLAMQYAINGEIDQALSVMTAAGKRAQDSPQAILLLAHLAQTLQQPELALQYFRRAITLAPRQSAYHLQLAIFYTTQPNEDDEALAVLEAALPQVEDPLPILRVLGDLYAARFSILSKDNQSPETEQQRDDALRRAIACYRQAGALAHDELWWDYQNKLADLLLLDEKPDEAAAVLTLLVSERPDDGMLRKKLLLCQITANTRQDALAQLQQLLKDQPHNAEAQNYLGDLQTEAGDVPAAIAAYNAALKLDPANTDIRLKLALLLASPDLEQAIQILRAGQSHTPQNWQLLDLLARLLIRAERGSEALEIFGALQEQLEATSPDALKATFWMGYAEAARQSDRSALAVRLYKRAIEAAPEQLPPYLNLALLLMAEGAPQAAITTMQQAVTAMPDGIEAHYMLGMIACHAAAYAEAYTAFEHATQLAEQLADADWEWSAEYYYYYGVAAEREQHYEQAARLLLHAAAMDPDHAEVFNYLAYMWAEQNVNLNQALPFIRHALDFDPHNAAYLDTLGWVYFKLKRFGEAETEIYNALLILPDDPVILEHYGDVMAALGRNAEALTWWLASRQAKADNPELDAKLQAHGVSPSTQAADDDTSAPVTE